MTLSSTRPFPRGDRHCLTPAGKRITHYAYRMDESMSLSGSLSTSYPQADVSRKSGRRHPLFTKKEGVTGALPLPVSRPALSAVYLSVATERNRQMKDPIPTRLRIRRFISDRIAYRECEANVGIRRPHFHRQSLAQGKAETLRLVTEEHTAHPRAVRSSVLHAEGRLGAGALCVLP